MEKEADVIQKRAFKVSEVHLHSHHSACPHAVPLLYHGDKQMEQLRWEGALEPILHMNAAESSVLFIAPHQPFIHNYGIFPECSLHHARGHNVFSSIRTGGRWL